jgi:hypothetical protein
VHSELVYGDGVIMVGEERKGATQRFGADAISPRCRVVHAADS